MIFLDSASVLKVIVTHLQWRTHRTLLRCLR
jgi:hypothetical protein